MTVYVFGVISRPLGTGDPVVILTSRHSDVSQGAKGTVAGQMPGGYAVQISGRFSDAAGRVSIETRCIFFEAEDIAPADNLPNSK